MVSSERKKKIIRLMIEAVPNLVQQKQRERLKAAKYGALCVYDALAGRLSSGLASNSKKSKLEFTLFSIQTSEVLLNLILFCSIMHTLCTYIEPDPPSDSSLLIRAFHCFCVFLYVSDVLLKMSYQGVEGYFDSEWQRLYATSAGLNFFDLVVHGGRTSWCNCLRPVAGLLRSREGRRFFEAVQKMVPIVIESLVPLSLFIIVVAIFCALTFGDSLQVGSSLEHHYNWFWLILTGDTLGKLLPETLFSNALYQFFFFAMIYIGQKFLLSLILGATFDTFKSMTEKQLKKEKVKELQGLVKAFAAVDVNKQGHIDMDMWDALMHEMHFSPEESAIYYELISGGAEKISVFQFLGLKGVLDYRFTFGETAPNFDYLARSLATLIPDGYEVILSDKIVKSGQKMLWKLTDLQIERTYLILCCVDIILLLSGRHNMQICNTWSVPFISVYTILSTALAPSIVPALFGKLQYLRTLPLKFESLECLLEASVYHIIYVVVLIRSIHEICACLFQNLMYKGNTLISTHSIHAGMVVSMIHLMHAFVQLVYKDGNIKDLILYSVKTKDWVLMSVFFCVFVDVFAPLFGVSPVVDLVFSNGIIVLFRAISCLRVFGYKDTKALLRYVNIQLSSIKIILPDTIWNEMDKYYIKFKKIVDPSMGKSKTPSTGASEKDDKAEKKKKKKKANVIEPLDLPLRLRLGLVALDAVLLVADLHNTALIPIPPFSIITFCRIISFLYIFDTLVELRDKEGVLINSFPTGEITMSNVWILGKYYMIFASVLQITGLSYLPLVNNLTGSSLLCCVRLIRCLRAVELNKELETFMKAISGVTNLFCQQMMFAFVCVYIFAMLGNLLFGASSEHFVTPLAATLTCQRLFLPADFIDITEDTISNTSIFAIFFFVVFFFVSLVVCNIALSIVIEWYADCLNEDGKVESAKTEKAQETLMQGVVDRAHTRNALASMQNAFNMGKHSRLMSSRRKLHLDDLKITKKVSNDHRQQLVGGDVKLEKQDLMECKKYYHKDVDLIKDFKDFSQAQENQDDAAFIAHFVDSEIGERQIIEDGTILIETGKEAFVGYLLISGRVKVHCPSGHWYAISPLSFLGHEVMQPDAHYHFTYKSEGSVEVLRLSQEAVIHEMDDELAGSLVKLTFKTKENIQAAIDFERKNKTIRRRSLGLMTKQQAREQEETESKDFLSKARVLIANDKSKFAETATDVLVRMGCKVINAELSEGNIKSHQELTKHSATLTGLKRVETDDHHFEVVTGKLILRKPVGDVLSLETELEDLPPEHVGKKVLIVDDSGICRRSLSKIVNTLGFKTELAENGKVGCERLEADGIESYAAVLLDVRMPVFDGIETVEHIREKLHSDILVAFVTGDADEDVRKAMKEYKVRDCLIKPVQAGNVTTLFLQSGLLNPISP